MHGRELIFGCILCTGVQFFAANARPQPVSQRLQHPGYHATLETYWLPQEEVRASGVHKRVTKALLFSAAVPGLGQLSNRSYLKAGIFAAVEAVAWYLLIDQRNKGEQIEQEYELFADSHWDASRYWQALAEESGFDVTQLDSLRSWERSHFSHFLPDEKSQTYYENIGKYNQFNIGWDDASGHRERDSDNREAYTFMRKDSNDAFELSRTGSTIIIINHIASALEAAYTARRLNAGLVSAVRFKAMRNGREIVPAIAVRVLW